MEFRFNSIIKASLNTNILTINIHEAKLRLSELIEKAAAGEEIIIAKAGCQISAIA